MASGVAVTAGFGTSMLRDSSKTPDLPPVEQRCRVVVASTLRTHLAAVERVFRQCLVEGVRVPSGVNEQPRGHEEALQGAANRLDAAKMTRPGADFYVAIENAISEVLVQEPAAVNSFAATPSEPPPPREESSRGWRRWATRTTPQQPSMAESSTAGAAATPAPPRRSIRYFDTGWVLLERAVASGGMSGVRAAAPSAGVEMPAADVAAASERGLERVTAAALVAERVGLLDGAEGAHAWLTAGRRSRETLLGEALAVTLGQLERACRPSASPRSTGLGAAAAPPPATAAR